MHASKDSMWWVEEEIFGVCMGSEQGLSSSDFQLGLFSSVNQIADATLESWFFFIAIWFAVIYHSGLKEKRETIIRKWKIADCLPRKIMYIERKRGRESKLKYKITRLKKTFF
jgi:hypothetical protein